MGVIAQVPAGDVATGKLARWADAFESALGSGDGGRVAGLFAADGYWRDIPALEGAYRAFRGGGAGAAAGAAGRARGDRGVPGLRGGRRARQRVRAAAGRRDAGRLAVPDRAAGHRRARGDVRAAAAERG